MSCSAVYRGYSNNDVVKLFLKTLYYVTVAADVNASLDSFKVIVVM